MALTFGDITADHLDQVLEIRARSFGHIASRDEWLETANRQVQDRRFIGVFDGDHPVAAARIWNFTQWWAGRQVPMGGVGGVVVSPEYRGRGVGSLLMRGVLDRSRELGYPLSALYPATVVIYRQLGYEFAGGRYRFSFPSADVRVLGGKDVALRPGGPDDVAVLMDLVARVRSTGRESGPIGWPEPEVRRWLADEKTFCYIAEDGFVVYTWDESDLRIDELIAASEPTARALWATVGSGSSIARSVHAYVAPYDPIHLMLGHEASKKAEVLRWMLRLVDAPAAIAARGWSPAVSVDVALEIDDPGLPENTGSWRLKVAEGAGSLTRSGSNGSALRVGARGIAALYAGAPVSALRTAGIATGGNPDDDALLDHAFAGPTPFMLDYF